MSKNPTDTFIDVLLSTELKTIPEHVLHHARRCLIDYLAATFAGAALIKSKTDILAENLGANLGAVSVLGSARKTDLSNAIFLNGIHSHYAELDDGVIAGIIHPGTPVFSALLPWAEVSTVSGEDFLRGVVLGYEACVRLAEAVQPSHKACGYHATATCGSVGVAYGICSMLGDSGDTKKKAISAAVVRAGGTLKVVEDGSELKPVNSGHAALLGHTSVAIAKSGFKGPEDVILGQNGFLQTMCETHNLERILESSDNLYCIERTYFKPYAACRYTHPAIEATLQLRDEFNIDIKNISTISVATYKTAVVKHDHQEITGISSAKMSIPISVAIALVTGKAGIEEFSKEILDIEIVQELSRKVSVEASEQFTQQFPEKSPAKVVINLNDGSSLERIVEFPKGEPSFPLSDDELESKLIDLALFSGMDKKVAKDIVDRVWNLPKDLNGLLRLFSTNK